MCNTYCFSTSKMVTRTRFNMYIVSPVETFLVRCQLRTPKDTTRRVRFKGFMCIFVQHLAQPASDEV